jgi:hypothetical protein
MKEFMDELLAIRSRSGALADELSKKHKCGAKDDPPLEAFGIFFNNATLAVELTSFYQAAWGQLPVHGLSPEQITQKRNENGERLTLLSKSMFMWAMSAMEFATKRALAKYPGVVKTKGKVKDLRLGEIIQHSADAGLIDQAHRIPWFGANTIRNRIVHNNGYADRTATLEFSNGLRIVMEDGNMIVGTIMTFPHLTSWLIGEYGVWCDRFLEKTSVPRSP